ncbi:MAG: hypothetical protein WCH57_02120 [Verrucomicrobiota bacterium]
MLFEEFQHLARLSVVGALDAREQAQFEAGRRAFGMEAERFLKECRKLNAVFALSLRPCAPDPRTKARLFARIREAAGRDEGARLHCGEEAPGVAAFSLGSVDRL